MWALMFDPRFNNLFILSNYVGTKKAIIVATKYDCKTIICPFYVQLIKKFILLRNTHKILAPKKNHW